jgi:hypothetical protein
MNPAVILALIGELYAQVASLTERNQQLEAALEAKTRAQADTASA